MVIKRTLDDGREVEFELTPRELRIAHEEQQVNLDCSDIEIELEVAKDDYKEFGIDVCPVTEDELSEMAYLLRKKFDRFLDSVWSECCAQAVSEILQKREAAEP